MPLLGALLYALLGINRILRKAQALRPESAGYEASLAESSVGPAEVIAELGPSARSVATLMPLGDKVTGRPLLSRNSVTPLVDGDEAYPAMLDAIDRARESVTLLTYIFDDDPVGRRFVEALGRAVELGGGRSHGLHRRPEHPGRVLERRGSRSLCPRPPLPHRGSGGRGGPGGLRRGLDVHHGRAPGGSPLVSRRGGHGRWGVGRTISSRSGGKQPGRLPSATSVPTLSR